MPRRNPDDTARQILLGGEAIAPFVEELDEASRDVAEADENEISLHGCLAGMARVS
jgi:hypothetical protein